MLTTLLAAAVVLGVLILVHELGHFWAAKLVDIEVPRFSIGMGPKAIGFRRGETEYVLSWLPLGGYVKMAGMEGEEALEGIEGEAAPPEEREPSPRDFRAKPLWARTLVVSAGVLMNMAFAVVGYGAVAAVWGLPAPREARIGNVQEERLPAGAFQLAALESGARVDSVDGRPVERWEDLQMALARAGPGPVTLHPADGPPVTVRVPESDSARRALAAALSPPVDGPARISEVAEGSPADSAGLRAGDLVRRVGGREVTGWDEFVQVVERRPGDSVPVVVERDGKRVSLTVVPELRTASAGGDTLRFGRIGVLRRVSRSRTPLPPAEAAAYGFRRTGEVTALVFDFLGQLVTGETSARDLGGPIVIAQWSGQSARRGGWALLNFMSLLSINLAILNLLPIPVLDGGHLAFLSVEAVRGRPVSAERRVRWTQVGVLIVAALMVWVIVNDILRVMGG